MCFLLVLDFSKLRYGWHCAFRKLIFNLDFHLVLFAVNAVIAAQIKKNQIKLEKDFIAIDLSDAAGDDNGKLKFVLLFLPVPEAWGLHSIRVVNLHSPKGLDLNSPAKFGPADNKYLNIYDKRNHWCAMQSQEKSCIICMWVKHGKKQLVTACNSCMHAHVWIISPLFF